MKSYIHWGSYVWWMLQLDDKDSETELIGFKLSSDALVCFVSFFSSWFHDLFFS